MSHVSFDRVKETTVTTGTGNVTLAGAVTGFRAFSAVALNADSLYYCIVNATGTEWEVGVGVYIAATPAIQRAAIFASSNANALVSFSAGTKEVFLTVPASINTQLDLNLALNLPAVAAEPPAPAVDNMSFYGRKVSGRMMPEWLPPVGVSCNVQAALFGNNVMMYTPTSGTTVTGGFGTLWAKGSSAGVVSHITPSTTAPAIYSQMKRTRHANAVTTTNQVMGITSLAEPSVWRGNAAGLGGFFFFCRFAIGLWPANTVRLFVGLCASEAAASDTPPINCCGFSHITTDGANVLKFITKDGTTLNSITVSGATLAAGQVFDAYIYCKPNDTTIYFRLDAVGGATLIDSSTGTNLPVNTAFMGPQATMSNGTANVTVTTTAIDVNKIYVESDR